MIYNNLIYIIFNTLKDINNSWKKNNSVYYVYYKIPYLNTTTSEQVENTKAFELTIIKELGKLTP